VERLRGKMLLLNGIISLEWEIQVFFAGVGRYYGDVLGGVGQGDVLSILTSEEPRLDEQKGGGWGLNDDFGDKKLTRIEGVGYGSYVIPALGWTLFVKFGKLTKVCGAVTICR